MKHVAVAVTSEVMPRRVGHYPVPKPEGSERAVEGMEKISLDKSLPCKAFLPQQLSSHALLTIANHIISSRGPD